MPLSVPTVVMTNNSDGTVDVAVSGSTAGSTNTLRTAPINTTWDNMLVWTDRGSVVGDGTIDDAAVPEGAYIAHVQSTLAGEIVVTVPEWLRVTDSTSIPPLDDLLTQVHARVLALGLEDMDASRVQIATVPDASFIRSLVAPTIIIASSGTEQFVNDRFVPTNVYRLGFPILICLAAPANHEHTASLRQKWLKWRDEIEQALIYKRFNGGISNTEWMLEPIMTPAQVVFDRTWWNLNALGAPVSIFYQIDKAIAA